MQRCYDHKSILCVYTSLVGLAHFLLGTSAFFACDQEGSMVYYLRTIANVDSQVDEESHY